MMSQESILQISVNFMSFSVVCSMQQNKKSIDTKMEAKIEF